MAHPTYSAADLYKIAKHQRRLLILILVVYAIPMLLMAIWFMSRVEILPGIESTEFTQDQFTLVLGVYAAILLAGLLLGIIVLSSLLVALRASNFEVVVMAIALLIPMPLIAFILLLIVSSRATRALRSAGYGVGLLGVGRATLAQLKALSQQTAPTLPAPSH